MKKVVVGMIGCGFASGLHMSGYAKIYGLQVEIKAVASNGPAEQTAQFVEQNGIKDIYEDYKEMLKDEEIDVIDICTPPFLHEEMVIESLKAGKHVICEKPLTGYFDEGEAMDPVGTSVKKSQMYTKVMERIERIREAVERSDRYFMYAENWVYAPSVLKSLEIIQARKDKILFMQAEESHNGSHAYHAANWKYTGGGALIRQGCHPVSVVLFLKQEEMKARGEKFGIRSVTADVGTCTGALKPEEKCYIDAEPVDVEDIANVTITFTDGTKAHVVSTDILVGGMKNRLELYTNTSVHRCNISQSNDLEVYHGNEDGLSDIYFSEKLGTKQGWQSVGLNEELSRGYLGELQDFMECVSIGRKPLSDFSIAYHTTRVLYAAYLSGEEHYVVMLDEECL